MLQQTSGKLTLGFLFLLLVVLIVAFLTRGRVRVPSSTWAIGLLRRSVKAHEIGQYNGYYVEG